MAFLKQGTGQGFSGRLGGVVYRRSGDDTVVAAAPSPNDPRSPRQAAARARLELCGWLWTQLPLDAIERWRRYATARRASSAPGGRAARQASGYAVFRGLAAKYLQVHGGQSVPTEPPTSVFLGDGVTIVPRAAADGSGVEFLSSGPNSEGVLTELLLQRLVARHRLPKAREYRTEAFVAFGGASARVSCAPGAYACAVRFVRAATGQATEIVPLGTVEVAAPTVVA